jgi:hypothetical protein
MKLFFKVAKSLGISDFVIEELSYFLLDYQRNAFGLGAPTDAVLEVRRHGAGAFRRDGPPLCRGDRFRPTDVPLKPDCCP